jgi:hypothetical protein
MRGSLFALGFPSTARANSPATERESLEDELAITYPRPPKKLDTDPTVSSVLLVDFDLKGIIRLNGVDGAALVMRGDDGEPIRAAVMKGRLVMFHTLEPGTYSLQFIRLSNYNANLVLKKPPTVEIDVTVARGDVNYLGAVVVTKKFGPKPPECQLIYDAQREIEAWSAFKEKYADSPWSALAEKRILSLRSLDKTQDDQR